ncbi:MAG: hypothetical protein K2X25_11555 [Caulobacteraceae bacterium]|nr:hypothetical protein [Caulobacteraceae bacterium]
MTAIPDEATVAALVAAAFDESFYLASNPDVAAVGVEALGHYQSCGWREFRDPTAWFSIQGYLELNPDVAAAALEPFRHYLLYGRGEGRRLGPTSGERTPTDPTGSAAVAGAFDADFYVAANPDLKLDRSDAFTHFMQEGWRENRDPARWFSVARYLAANPDVRSGDLNPLVHYIQYGRREGRSFDPGSGFDPGPGFRYDLIRASEGFEHHVQALARHVPDRPASPHADLVEGLTALAQKDRVHLTVSHDDYTTTMGGVQLCLKIESAAMRAAGAAHVHLFPGRAAPVIDVDRDQPRLGVLVDGILIGYFDAPAVREAMEQTCAHKSVSVAVHSLIAHRAPDILSILETLSIDHAYYWLHDYSSLCANYALMRNDAVFCGAPPPQSLACEICSYGARRQIHLAEHARLFEAVDPIVVAPSEAALALWRRVVPFPARRAIVHTHATLETAPRRRRPPAVTVPVDSDRPLRIGFLGMPTSHKGWPVFARMVSRFADDPRYSFHHLARETVPALAIDWIHVAPGPGDETPMIDAVEALGLDVALIWSLWPETFCFAAFEAVAGGASIVTNPDSGNVHGLVRHLGCGLVVEDDVALEQMFTSGEILGLARARRRPRRQTLAYSRMTADLIPGLAP